MALKPLQSLPAKGGLKIGQKSENIDSTWRLRWLLAAPHRLGFSAGAVMLALSACWWLVILLMRTVGGELPWIYAPATAHSVLMALGFTPLFFAGFLFTAGPKWLNMPEVDAPRLLPHVVLTLLGWSLCFLGFHLSSGLAATGMAMVALAWSGLIFKFATLWHKSIATDKLHATFVVLAGSYGALAMWVIAFGLLTGQENVIRSATLSTLWIFVATVFSVVSHRMIPFFSTSALPFLDAWRPMWLLWCMVGVLWFEGAMAGLEAWGLPNTSTLHWLQVAVEGPFAVLMVWLAVRWGLVQSLKIRLLAMLHGGFLWLGIALALQALSHTLMALSDNQVSLGLAPLHAMTMGYLGATLFAMGTRVASGHSGRPLAADNTAWTLYWVLQLAVLLRVVSALWPQAGSAPLLAAIVAWTLAACGWALRYGNWFGRPRVDGRPG
jgi:uncharacterized protein involved in response to NO